MLNQAKCARARLVRFKYRGVSKVPFQLTYDFFSKQVFIRVFGRRNTGFVKRALMRLPTRLPPGHLCAFFSPFKQS